MSNGGNLMISCATGRARYWKACLLCLLTEYLKTLAGMDSHSSLSSTRACESCAFLDAMT